MMYANSRQEALKERKKFEQAFRHNPKAGQAPIEEKDWEYLWADGIYVKAGKGKEKAALLVVIGVNGEGEKRYLALEAGYRESKESWAGVLRQLKTRGVKNPRLFIGEGTWGYGLLRREAPPSEPGTGAPP